MRLILEENEKNDIKYVINEYSEINVEMESLQNKANEIQKQYDLCSTRLEALQRKEKTLIDDLKKKYGNITLDDISRAINE